MSDDASVDAVIRALYETISGPAGPRDWPRLRALFMPDARLVHAGHDAPRPRLIRVAHTLVVRGMQLVGREHFARALVARRRGAEPAPLEAHGIDSFLAIAKKSFAREGMWETEIDRRTEESGAIAHVLSRYEARRTVDGPPTSRGANSIQLVRTGGGWRIVSLVWDDDSAG